MDKIKILIGCQVILSIIALFVMVTVKLIPFLIFFSRHIREEHLLFGADLSNSVVNAIGLLLNIYGLIGCNTMFGGKSSIALAHVTYFNETFANELFVNVF